MGFVPAASTVYKKDVLGVSVLLVTVSPGRAGLPGVGDFTVNVSRFSTYAVILLLGVSRHQQSPEARSVR